MVEHFGHGLDALGFAHKLMLGHFMAVAHHLAGALEPVDHGGAERYYQRSRLSQMLVGGCDALVHHLHGAHLVDARKLAVKQETVPHAAALKHVRPVDGLAIDDALYRGGYAEGIVKRSKGVDIHIKHGVAHPCPYIVGETRTHHHHHVAVAYHASILTRLY